MGLEESWRSNDMYFAKLEYILSIWWGYCSGAALFRVDLESGDFEILGASSEERFTKEKEYLSISNKND